MRIDKLSDLTDLELRKRFPFPEPKPVPADASPAPKYHEVTREEIEALSEGQQLALISMSRSIRSTAIWQTMRERYSVPPFTLSTFIELRGLGYADKPDGEKYHRLTALGFRAADMAGEIVQQKYSIHAAYLLGAVKATQTLMCTCKWSCGLRRGDNMQVKANNAFSRHLITVNAMNDLATALVPGAVGENPG